MRKTGRSGWQRQKITTNGECFLFIYYIYVHAFFRRYMNILFILVACIFLHIRTNGYGHILRRHVSILEPNNNRRILMKSKTDSMKRWKFNIATVLIYSLYCKQDFWIPDTEPEWPEETGYCCCHFFIRNDFILRVSW